MGTGEGAAGKDAFFFGQLSLGCAEAVNGGGGFKRVLVQDELFNPLF